MNAITEKISNAPASAKYGVATALSALALAGGVKSGVASAETPMTPDQAALQDQCVTDALYSFEGGTVGYAPGSTRIVAQRVAAGDISPACDAVVERVSYTQQWLGKKPARLHPNTVALEVDRGNDQFDVTRRQKSWIRWTCDKFFRQVVTVQAESPSGDVIASKQYKGQVARPTCKK